jgi:hypothetical protein
VGKLILLSLLIGTLVIPMRASRAPSAALGFRRTLFWLFSFNAIYLFLVLYVFPRFA